MSNGCQRFGHKENQCFRPFQCVKCGNEYPTTKCIKNRTLGLPVQTAMKNTLPATKDAKSKTN